MLKIKINNSTVVERLRTHGERPTQVKAACEAAQRGDGIYPRIEGG